MESSYNYAPEIICMERYNVTNISIRLSYSCRMEHRMVHELLDSCTREFSIFRINTLRLRQNGRHFPGVILNCIFLNENLSIAIGMSTKFVPKTPINNIPSLVQLIACRLVVANHG